MVQPNIRKYLNLIRKMSGIRTTLFQVRENMTGRAIMRKRYKGDILIGGHTK